MFYSRPACHPTAFAAKIIVGCHSRQVAHSQNPILFRGCDLTEVYAENAAITDLFGQLKPPS